MMVRSFIGRAPNRTLLVTLEVADPFREMDPPRANERPTFYVPAIRQGESYIVPLLLNTTRPREVVRVRTRASWGVHFALMQIGLMGVVEVGGKEGQTKSGCAALVDN
jgi:hypothetical protein